MTATAAVASDAAAPASAMMMVAARLQDLAEIEAAVWHELEAATRDDQHDWHVATLATWDGQQVDARCVVLRDADTESRTLLIYTDTRSAKARQLERHPLATLVAWSPRLGWQLRLRVHLSLQSAGLAVSSRWARMKMSPAVHDYLSPLPPDDTARGAGRRGAPPQRSTREHFAVIEAQVDAFDWLELHEAQHRRARFDAQGARWVTP